MTTHLARAARWGRGALLITLPLPLLFGEGIGPLVIAAALAAIVAALATSETGEARRTFVDLAVLGAAVRAVTLLAVAWLQAAGDAMALGPDGAKFLAAAVTILDAGFQLPEPSYVMLGTFDVAHMFVFAGVIGAFGQSVLDIQVLNCAATTLLAPLTFGWVRRVAPAVAVPVATLVAVYPSIVYLSSVDIWKDPLVITATTFGIWALTHVIHDAPPARSRLMFAAIAAGSLAFVHTSRFYPLWYLEVGVILMAAFAVARRRPVAWPAALATAAVLLVAEIVPMAGGWPPTARQFAAGIVQATNAPSMRRFTAGLLERLADGGTAPPDRSTGFEVKKLDGFRRGRPGGFDTLRVDIEQRSAEPERFGIVGWATQVVRRVWGPFVWIAPPALTARALLAGDYLLFPGMLFWYALIPFMAAGTIMTGLDVVRGRAAFMVGVVWVYAAAYYGQFLVINLPYRQREAMFPVLLVFALVAVGELWHRRWVRQAYALYWGGLAAVAVAHNVVRAGLG